MVFLEGVSPTEDTGLFLIFTHKDESSGNTHTHIHKMGVNFNYQYGGYGFIYAEGGQDITQLLNTLYYENPANSPIHYMLVFKKYNPATISSVATFILQYLKMNKSPEDTIEVVFHNCLPFYTLQQDSTPCVTYYFRLYVEMLYSIGVNKVSTTTRIYGSSFSTDRAADIKFKPQSMLPSEVI